MTEYTAALRRLCEENHSEVAPYLLRTRFERNLFGLLVTYSDSVFGIRPLGVTERHVRDLLAKVNVEGKEKEAELLQFIAKLFGRFTYLCDTSNWSDDGQDPRVEMCRNDIVRLCDLAESLQSS